MKTKIIPLTIFLVFALFISGCSPKPKAEIVSAEYVDAINAGGVYLTYEGMDILQIILDLTFDEEIVSDLDPTSANYRKELYSILVKGAYIHDSINLEIELAYGYWPVEADSNHAKGLSLFYVFPEPYNPDAADPRFHFTYDGSVLGENGQGIDIGLQPLLVQPYVP